MLPADSHVHSEWSWDAVAGDMAATCARAVAIGLPAVAFTEHVDLTPSSVTADEVGAIPPHARGWLRPSGEFVPPELDVAGYLSCVERCRERFPGLRIRAGIEMSEPHRHLARLAGLLDGDRFDRVLGSVHAVRTDLGNRPLDLAFHDRPVEAVMGEYLAEIRALTASEAPFQVLAHIDYPARYWPGVFRATDFEDDLRATLVALAASGRALEINTRVPLAAEIIRWWAESGGEAVSFGSDAHHPDAAGHGFREAAVLAEAAGFRGGETQGDLWHRRPTSC
ncbi:MAG: PHP domain-containing protein [Pseudonocardia sp.]|uniref:PHP domain-containing protein n=1 Tax=Pseudonocardia sp. TaxID=60912 RepID=UPI001ACD3500|nr:PHP domain-containing protein [Pseudonocardia sp.]MBN9100280.1 PHP domain-containing protein [Pseudonocardia sp.]